MPSILQRKRERQLRMLADSLLLEEQQAEEHRKALQESEEFGKTQRRLRLEAARRAEASYLEGARDFENGLRQAMAGFKRMLESLSPLHCIPGGGMVAGSDAVTTRASRFLAAQLFSATRRSSHFGQCRIHYSGRPSPADSFCDAERDTISRIFPRNLNGAGNNHESESEDQS